jgi:hypothetical protein
MAAVRLDLELPENLAREARDNGLLTPGAIEAMLRAELERRRVAEAWRRIDDLRREPGDPMPASEIQAEIDAARRDRRGSDARRP